MNRRVERNYAEMILSSPHPLPTVSESASRRDPTFVKPCPLREKGEMCVIPVLLDIVQAISSVRLYFPKDLKSLDNRQSVGKSLQEVQKRFPDGLPQLDPLEDMGIKEQGLKVRHLPRRNREGGV